MWLPDSLGVPQQIQTQQGPAKTKTTKVDWLPAPFRVTQTNQRYIGFQLFFSGSSRKDTRSPKVRFLQLFSGSLKTRHHRYVAFSDFFGSAATQTTREWYLGFRLFPESLKKRHHWHADFWFSSRSLIKRHQRYVGFRLFSGSRKQNKGTPASSCFSRKLALAS